MARILRVGGVGIPNVDAYVPKLSLLTTGLATLQEMAGDHPTEKQVLDIELVQRAIASRAKLYDFVEENGGLRKGAKDEINAGNFEEMKSYVLHFADAANVLNHLPKDKALPEFIKIKHLGGTITNKLNGYKGGRGDNIEAVIIGVVGNDVNGGFVRGELKGQSNGNGRGITLLDNKVRCDATPLHYVLTEDRQGHPLGDRHILKGKTNATSVLRANEKYILDEVAKLDRLMLEGSEISGHKFGHDLFDKIVTVAIQQELDLAFAPCTSRAARTEDPRNAAVLARASYYHHNDMPTVFNMEELLDNYLPDAVKSAMPKGYAVTDATTDPYVATAIANLKLELANRERDMPRTNNQTIAVVSDGGNGVFIMTSKPEQTLMVPAPKDVKVVDTTGAGDNLTAGAFIKSIQLANEHRNFNIGQRQELSDEQLVEIAEFAQKIAKLAIEQQGACVDHDKILRVLKEHAPVPVRASMVGIRRLGNNLSLGV